LDHQAEPPNKVAMNWTRAFPPLTLEGMKIQQGLERVPCSNRVEFVHRCQISTLEGEARGKKCHLSLVKKA
jgi:hypothetical protein